MIESIYYPMAVVVVFMISKRVMLYTIFLSSFYPSKLVWFLKLSLNLGLIVIEFDPIVILKITSTLGNDIKHYSKQNVGIAVVVRVASSMLHASAPHKFLFGENIFYPPELFTHLHFDLQYLKCDTWPLLPSNFLIVAIHFNFFFFPKCPHPKFFFLNKIKKNHGHWISYLI